MTAGLTCRRPTLRAVDHIDDFDRPGGFQHPVNYDEGQWRQGQFACPFHPATPPLIRVGSEGAGAIVNDPHHARSRAGVIRPNVVEELLEVASGGG